MKHEYNDITQIYTFDDIEDLFKFIRRNKEKIRGISIESCKAEFKCYQLLDETE